MLYVQSCVGVTAGSRHALILAERGVMQLLKDPLELVNTMLQPVIILLLCTYVLGGALAGSPEAYLQYALPGIIVQTSLMATVRTGLGLFFDLNKGIFDRLKTLPIARSAPLGGRLLAEGTKHVWSAGMLITVGSLLGFRLLANVLEILAAVFLLLIFTLSVSWATVFVAIRANEPEKVMVLGYFIALPLTIASNLFVPARTMPTWLRDWVCVNPVTHLADALRGLLVAGPVATPAMMVLLWSAAITAVFAPLSLRALRYRR